MPRQLVTDNLAIVLVVFDEKDADGIRFCALGWLGSLARNWEATAHGAGGRRGRLMSPPWASLREGASARGDPVLPTACITSLPEFPYLVFHRCPIPISIEAAARGLWVNRPYSPRS
jgi:hypothetical protein